MPDFVALIPARLASTRLPNKPLALIGDVPMVVHVARRAKESGASVVAVATDSSDVAQAVTAHGIQALLTRADHQSGTERLAEASAKLGLSENAIVVNVQGDEPFISPELIANVAITLEKTASAPMATAAHPIHALEEYFSPNVVKLVTDAQGQAMMFSRAPFPYPRDSYHHMLQADKTSALSTFKGFTALRHIGLYAYRNHFLAQYSTLSASPLEAVEALEQLRVLHHGYRIAVHVTNDAPAAGVDTPDDLEKARQHWLALSR